MKLVLASNPKVCEVAINKTAELVGKPLSEINVVVIIEAFVGDVMDHRWVLKELSAISTIFAGKFEIINLLSFDWKHNKSIIDKADLIYCLAGNTQHLLNVFEKSGFAKHLPEILKEKVWLGSSAGTQVIGVMPTLETVKKIYNEELYGVNHYLNLVDFVIVPYACTNPDNKRFRAGRFEQCVVESKKQKNVTIYSLSDESAVVVDGEKVSMIGKDCRKILNGEVVEEIGW